MGTDISLRFIEDLSKNLVTKVFFTGACEYHRVGFTGGRLGVQLFSVLPLSCRFILIPLELVET
jgi:hypothetical protein